MENNNNNRSQNDNEETNQNANSAYSGSGSMQPGAGTGEAGRLSDYDQDESGDDETKDNKGGKSIDEATDPSKLSSL